MPSDTSAIPPDFDGTADLPPGKIAAVVTFLELRRPPDLPPPGGDWTLDPIGADLDRYRALFRRVGEPWLWFSRLVIPEAELRAILSDERVEAFALRGGGEDVGLLELDFRTAGECELSFLGVVPERIGAGAGRFLIGQAVARAFARPIRRLFVHTCTLDHPGALAFYLRAGFRPYRRAVEIADDPRLTGHLPRDAAPQVPLFPPESPRR
ncbi:MAG TPA: GNAT family N-acetyltransferase [Beijerinckiaceae bacterium]|jgi:GNAT superfamily N-acetyltransferase